MIRLTINRETGFPELEPSPDLVDQILHLFGRTSPDPDKEFRDVLSFMRTNRRHLARLAMEYYKSTVDGVVQPIAGVDLLGRESWIARPGPIELIPDHPDGVGLELVTGNPSRNDWIYKASASLPSGTTYVESLLAYFATKEANERPMLEDDPIYQLVQFDSVEGRPRFTCSRNTYFAHMDNCELLHFEFARAIMRRLLKSSRWSKSTTLKSKHLPLRSALDAFAFDNRCVGIGISTILIEKRGSESRFLKHQRAKNATSEGMGTEHVVPAGTFQPRRRMAPQDDPDFSIYRNILRELGEELLGREEMQHVQREFEDITQQPRIELYHELILEGKAKVFFLGWGLDPLTTKAEILTAMVVDVREREKKEAERNFKDSWEGVHGDLPFVKNEVDLFVNGGMTQPAGAGCAKLAWEHKEQILNSVA